MPQKLAHLSSELCRTEVRKRWVFICGPIMCFLAMTHQQISCQALCGTQISMAPARLVEDTRLVMRAKAVGGPKRKDSKKQAQVQKERKKRDDVIELEGTVVVHSRNVFKVLLSNGAEVQCTLAGKLRMNNIKGAQFHTLVLDGAGG
ncbi:unnamed protein product [Durusdinium trenchii]|uniref:Uncharacterized protein n=1 Tax=Durusdinium trenchii TaxID=1381693 RepID=A0ABP0KCH3_9DINO